MEKLHTNTRKLDGVQSLRGFAVMMVVLSHFAVTITGKAPADSFFNIFTSNSPFAVDLFFFISGFIIVYTTQGHISSGVIRSADFLIKRIFRIFPVYYFCLAVFVVLVMYYDYFAAGKELQIESIIKSIFLLPLDPSKESPFYGYSAIVPAWTITYEVYFYAVFFASLLVTSKYRTITCSILLIGVSIAVQKTAGNGFTFNAESVSLHHDSIFYNLSFIANPIVFDFVIGMIAAEFFMSKIYRGLVDVFDVISPIMLCVGVASFVSMFRFGYGITHGAIGALCLFISVLHYDFSHSVKYPRPLVYLGDISYSLYMSHVVTINICDRYSEALFVYTNAQGWRRFVVIIALAIGVAAVMRRVIEMPSTKVAKNLVNRIKKAG
ncbi:acyltransferase family protein [Serratia odorifera]|uniref:acyltransferase family protein n=1 Tax=Serratia odorifera TaxID=618 RepID=UPI003D2E5737